MQVHTQTCIYIYMHEQQRTQKHADTQSTPTFEQKINHIVFCFVFWVLF